LLTANTFEEQNIIFNKTNSKTALFI